MRLPKWLLWTALALILVPWLGETLFNTKGEPREAIVAVSMLQSGNWVLPVSYGADIPYKPPFLAWLIAIFAKYLNGGVVNEFVSRLPSALAAIAMIMGGYAWARKFINVGIAATMALVTVTCFEVYRAAVACRVDMVLTACMVLALYQMYFWWQQGKQGERWHSRKRLVNFGAGILLLSGAVLSKGPVGALLPCLCMGLFCLISRDNFFKSVGWLSLMCLCSFIIPALWYWQAYLIGGDHFAALAWEENIGRLTGSMGYESHINPWYYNFITILTGMLPWTLLAIMSVFAMKRSRNGRSRLKQIWDKIASADHAPYLFAWVTSLTVLIFYCIPESKRSVYLLPMYPFMALGVAWILIKIRRSKALRIYRAIIVALALILPLAAIAAQFIHLKHPLELMPWWRYPLALMPWAVVYILHKTREDALVMTLGATLAIYFSYASAIQPMVLNGKSDKTFLPQCQEIINRGIPIYTHIANDSLLRYYTLNFYLEDRLRRLDPEQIPPRPYAIIGDPTSLQQALGCDCIPADCDTLTLRSCDTRRPMLLIIKN